MRTKGSAAYHAAYRAANREKLRAYDAAYEAAYPEKRRPHRAAWRLAHKAEQAAYAAAGKFGERVPLEIWRPIWSGACFGCGKTPAEGVDHIIPKVRGGRNVVENLQPACWPCNDRKGAREPELAQESLWSRRWAK